MSDTWGAASLKTTSRLFSQVLGCRWAVGGWWRRSDAAALAGPPALGAPVNSLLILVTPSQLRCTRDETWPPLPAWVTAGTPVAQGGSAVVSIPPPTPTRHHLALPGCPPALWLLDNEPFWGLRKAQCSHLTPGLTSCLRGEGWGKETGGFRGGGRSGTRLLTVWLLSEERLTTFTSVMEGEYL